MKKLVAWKALIRGTLREKLEHAANRDAHPVRPMIQLINDLVQRLFEKIRIKEQTKLLTICRQMGSGGAGGEISPQKRSADPPLPESPTLLQSGNIFRANDRAFGLA